MSRVDRYLRRFLLFSKLFTKSWGQPKVLEELFHFRRTVIAQRQVLPLIEQQKNPVSVTRTLSKKGPDVLNGTFESPLAIACPGLMPDPVNRAHWRALVPRNDRKAAVILLAATGDHAYTRRTVMFARSLASVGITAVMLTNPFYFRRRPKDQFRSVLLHVSDLFVMGAALICECTLLLNWLRHEGYQALALSGISMGGHMASLAATNWPGRLGLIPCLSWTTAAPVFTQGELSRAVAWPVLRKELETSEFLRQIEAIPDCDWLAQLARTPRSIDPTRQFMNILMDEFTNLRNFPQPTDPRLVRCVVAEWDAYVPRNEPDELIRLWPGAEVTVVPGGHVTGFLNNRSVFLRKINEVLSICEQSC